MVVVAMKYRNRYECLQITTQFIKTTFRSTPHNSPSGEPFIFVVFPQKRRFRSHKNKKKLNVKTFLFQEIHENDCHPKALTNVLSNYYIFHSIETFF